MAHQLIDRFGTLVAVLRWAAFDTSLGELDANIAARLHEIAQLFNNSLRRDAAVSIKLGDLKGVMLYLRAGMATLPVEVFRVLFLNGDNYMIEDRTLWAGTIDRVQIHIREVVRQALELDAVALIVAHNHTSAPITPSTEDRSLTRRLIAACSPFDLRVSDHLIVGRAGAYSMRASGLLDKLECDVRESAARLDRAA